MVKTTVTCFYGQPCSCIRLNCNYDDVGS